MQEKVKEPQVENDATFLIDVRNIVSSSWQHRTTNRKNIIVDNKSIAFE
jgi:hypothetical protein